MTVTETEESTETVTVTETEDGTETIIVTDPEVTPSDATATERPAEGAPEPTEKTSNSVPVPPEATQGSEPVLPPITFVDSRPTFELLTEDLVTFEEDFETFADGVDVPRAAHGYVEGDDFYYHDAVTFQTWPASELTSWLPADEPVFNGVVVAGDSAKWQKGIEYVGAPWIGGDSAILATAGSNLKSGYDAIQANFAEPMRSVAFSLSINRFGFTVEVYVEGDTDEPSEVFDIEPMSTLVVGAHIEDENAPRITAMRVVPKPHFQGGYGTWWWSVWSLHFAK
ncbi:MAG: hypothetical protein QF464_06080 [Myxococcota bacterium]|nr:hypothetical protein [Myxococcota bacterium]